MNRPLISPQLLQWIAKSEAQAIAKIEYYLQPRPEKEPSSNLTKEKL
ncbi:hypothetical protein [uncultured Brevibacillus sp.]|nr:hypothetical protein [uncultured Brevibacillus sp.]